jgi:sigma-B regulation protein RsbU (phosphoserine phosphatase)
MERHNDMFFTMWYGVYDRQGRSLRWAGGGHPPALLIPPGSAANRNPAPAPLDSDNPLLGAIEGLDFSSQEVAVPPESTLYLFSDGAYEITRPDGSMGTLDRFQELLASRPRGGTMELDTVVEQIRTLAGGVDLADDLSILAVSFG